MFAQARFYDADTGRFQTEDKVKGAPENPATLNLYCYCRENPITLVDKDGNSPSDCEETETYTYDRDAVRAYAALRQGESSTDEYIYSLLHPGFRNPDYVNLWTTNCANFVSQCLVAGGVGYTEDWYHRKRELKFFDASLSIAIGPDGEYGVVIVRINDELEIK